MRKLLVLTAIGILMVSAIGCRSCDWLFRGSEARQPAPVICEPACNPCEAVPACGPAGAILPGPGM